MTLFFLYWLISGLTCLIFACIELNGKDEQYKEIKEDITECNDKDTEVVVGVTFALVYAFWMFFGFLVLPVVVISKLIRKIKEDENEYI